MSRQIAPRWYNKKVARVLAQRGVVTEAESKSMAVDALEDAARLVTAVGECYARARRYRALAGDSETRFLDRALTLGGELRALARTAVLNVEAAVAIAAELRRIVAECAAGVAAVHASAPYRAAVRAWDAGELAAVAARAPDLFDGVVPDAAERALYFPVAVTSSRRGGEHFLTAGTLADRIVALLRDGIPAADPPPERGADDHIGAVVLDDDAEAAPGPITLAFLPGTIALPRLRLEPAGEVLVYAPRLVAPGRVRCAAHVTDEWWAVRPEAYPRYVEALTCELALRGIDNVERE